MAFKTPTDPEAFEILELRMATVAQSPQQPQEEEEVVMAEPESSNNNSSSSSSNNNNNVANNNNNNNGGGKGGKKEGKLPPCSSISNNSFLWDPDVDGEMVNMPLVPQLITEVQPGDELTDLTELVGPELATLVAADPSASRNIPMDIANINQSDLFNLGQNIDINSFLDEFSQRGGEGGNGGPTGQTFRKVIIARKAAAGAASEPSENNSGDNNNNNNNNNNAAGSVMGRFVPVSCESGSKALLLQHREPREGAGASIVRDKSGEAVTLTVVRGDPGGSRGGFQQISHICHLAFCSSCIPVKNIVFPGGGQSAFPRFSYFSHIFCLGKLLSHQLLLFPQFYHSRFLLCLPEHIQQRVGQIFIFLQRGVILGLVSRALTPVPQTEPHPILLLPPP